MHGRRGWAVDKISKKPLFAQLHVERHSCDAGWMDGMKPWSNMRVREQWSRLSPPGLVVQMPSRR